MHRRIEVVTTIDQPVQRVFAYLADPATWHLFAPVVVMRRRMDGGPGLIGTNWEAVDGFGPFKVRFIDQLVALETDRRVVWASSAPWNARTEYLCEPVGSGTRVRATYEGDLEGRLRPLAWVPTPIVALVLAQDMRRLRARLAAEADFLAAVSPNDQALPDESSGVRRRRISG